MDSLLNSSRPPVFCPGCSHDRMVHALDKAFTNMGITGEQIAIVSDIGCSGLFDTFFNTHAFHGLHGRALTYATGLKMAQPELNVVVTMGDGGLGIGGAHLLSTCRKNIGLTLLVLNNFNYGMTGGQCSSTTPPDALVGSGFLNRLEKPIDVCRVCATAGAEYVARASTYQKDLPEQIEAAIRFQGFSVMDVWGICPGRFTKRNKLTPKTIQASLDEMPPVDPLPSADTTAEYGQHYRKEASRLAPVSSPVPIEAQFTPLETDRNEALILGSAGQRIVTAGEILCLAGITAGLHASQKNDYPITVLQGHSVSELILSEKEIGYTGIDAPSVVMALAPEGVNRRRAMFAHLPEKTLVIVAKGVDLPTSAARVVTVDFKAHKIRPQDWALSALGVLAGQKKVINAAMLTAALKIRFKGKVLEEALGLVERNL